MHHDAATILDPFRVLDPSEREQQLAAYLGYLRETDGDPDIANRTLSKRDDRFAEFERKLRAEKSASVPLDGIDAYMGARPPDTLDKRWLWLLIAAKANRGEKYGADRKAEELQNQVLGDSPAVTEAITQYILLEEQYHTKILVGACSICNLEIEIPDPPRALRVLINQMLKLPKLPSDFLVFLGEVVGVHVFQLMLDNIGLFSEDPALERNLEDLVREILNDEVGHVVYCRTQLGPTSMKLARTLVGLMGRRIVSEIPEIGILAGGNDRFLAKLRQPIRFPRDVGWLNEPALPS